MKLDISREFVEESMKEARLQMESYSVDATLLPSYEITSNDRIKVNVGRIGMYVPPKVMERIFTQARTRKDPNDTIARLFIRYSPLGPGSGFFWSAPLYYYKYLASTAGKLPIVECFASPFNHAISNFCSAFVEDMYFGAKGEFFSYIKHLTEKKIKCRLSVNPPYTNEVIAESMIATVNYVRAVPGGEAIFMLPEWSKETFEKFPTGAFEDGKENVTWEEFTVKGGHHELYSYMDSMHIKTKMDLRYVLIASPGHTNTMDAVEIQKLVDLNHAEGRKLPEITVLKEAPTWVVKEIKDVY